MLLQAYSKTRNFFFNKAVVVPHSVEPGLADYFLVPTTAARCGLAGEGSNLLAIGEPTDIHAECFRCWILLLLNCFNSCHLSSKPFCLACIPAQDFLADFKDLNGGRGGGHR